MSAYVYKVTAKIIKDENGEPANLLAFAFKPSRNWDEATENKVLFETGCYTAERYVEKSANFTGRVCMDPGGPSIAKTRGGTITDYGFDDRVIKERKENA